MLKRASRSFVRQVSGFSRFLTTVSHFGAILSNKDDQKWTVSAVVCVCCCWVCLCVQFRVCADLRFVQFRVCADLRFVRSIRQKVRVRSRGCRCPPPLSLRAAIADRANARVGCLLVVGLGLGQGLGSGVWVGGIGRRPLNPPQHVQCTCCQGVLDPQNPYLKSSKYRGRESLPCKRQCRRTSPDQSRPSPDPTSAKCSFSSAM